MEKNISIGNIVELKNLAKNPNAESSSDPSIKAVVTSLEPFILISLDGKNFWLNARPEDSVVVGECDLDTFKNVAKGTSHMFMVREIWRSSVLSFILNHKDIVEKDCGVDPTQAVENIENNENIEEVKQLSLSLVPKLATLKNMEYIFNSIEGITEQVTKHQKTWGKKFDKLDEITESWARKQTEREVNQTTSQEKDLDK